MRPTAAQAGAPGSQAAAPALPALLADRQGVVFVATARGVESLRVPRRYWGTQVGVVPIPASDEEIRAAELGPPPDAGTWPQVVSRPDLLAPALSRLVSGEHVELSLQPGRDGLKASLLTAHGDEQPFPIAPKDALGFLAAVFQHAPRGVVTTGLQKPPRVLLSVRPAVRRHEYRLRLAGVVAVGPPSTLSDIGLSPAVLEMALESLDRLAGIMLVSGAPTSGRSTTLELMAAALVARGRRGGRIGARRPASKVDLTWLADAVPDWPFPESLRAAGSDFVLIETLEGPGDLVLAARLAASGCLVLAGAPAAEPEALARTVERDLEAGSAPAVPVVVLSQALVRTVCRGCLTWRTIPAEEARRHRFHRRDVEEMERRGGLAVPVGGGCGDCAGTGALGLTGVFEQVGPDAGAGTLPRLREDGWRKALQGIACLDDVATLPGAQRSLRTLREIMVHAGLGPAGIELPSLDERRRAPATGPAAPPATRASPPAARRETPAATPAAPEADLLARLLREAGAGTKVDPQALPRLAATLAERGAGQASLQGSLAIARGFRLAAHAVNSALIAARIASCLGSDVDAAGIALLALVHDAGLLDAGVDPDADLPAVLSEEVLDPKEARLAPSAALRRLGLVDTGLDGLVGQVHALLRFDPPAAAERARADLRAQVVALASLVDLHFQAQAVMEQHGRRFNPSLFRALLRAIPIFPIGALVELSSGDLARIVSLNEDNHFRPRVEIAAATGAEGLAERRVVDLARAPFLHIRQRVSGLVPGAVPAAAPARGGAR
ncbi:MAG: hypothetical protein DMF50_03190 [Acidobacteria bacterium]|nr:MAG: hypothetical protein DMF50_03190 [Acidobacteriota bacterium]